MSFDFSRSAAGNAPIRRNALTEAFRSRLENWYRVWLGGVALFLLLAGCSPAPPARTLQIQQTWQLQPGDTVAGRRVAGGLGDISIELKGSQVYAPADGMVQPNIPGCVVFAGNEIPAYVFRFCGITRPKLGKVRQGEAIGAANFLQFAALRRQPDGKWAMVEPSTSLLEQTLRKP